MTQGAPLADWKAFVIANGWHADVADLATITGQPIEAIQCLRATRACSRLTKAKGFAELFSLWNGRDPAEDDWPAPRKIGARATYEWQPPEVALLASLVGQISQAEIAEVLTVRLREKTGDPEAERTKTSVQVRTNQIGLQTTDVVGGLTTNEAARDIGSFAIVHQTIEKGELPTRRIGRLHVIPYEAWRQWKSKRVFPPAGYVQLSTIREQLAIKSDKLSEYARMGLIPTAIRCNPYGTKGPSTQFGTWWISKETADQLLADRRAGGQMPWRGKYPDNLRTTFKLWVSRKHPDSCDTCNEIWGEQGIPQNFAEYSARYTELAHGAKRHLTRPWTPGITLDEVSAQAGKTVAETRYAIEQGVLAATMVAGVQYVSRTNATRWIARKCPTGESPRSWISLQTASAAYFFTVPELRAFIVSGELTAKIGTAGAARGVEYVPRQQCAQLREKIGFTEEQAAHRLDISVEQFRLLVEGVDWRQTEKFPLVTVQAVRKRLESQNGYSISEAAEMLGKSVAWVNEQIEHGTARVWRTSWDHRRRYITEPMLQRLRDASERPSNIEKLGDEWLSLNDAAIEAGVSLATANSWGTNRELNYREYQGVRHYFRAAVRARARRYWQTIRFTRASPPAWLQEESRQKPSNAT